MFREEEVDISVTHTHGLVLNMGKVGVTWQAWQAWLLIGVRYASCQDCTGDNYGTLSDGSCCILEESFSPLRFASSLGQAAIRRVNLYGQGGPEGRCNAVTYTQSDWNAANWGPLDSACSELGVTAQGHYCCIEDWYEGQEQDVYIDNVAQASNNVGGEDQIDLRITAETPLFHQSKEWTGKDRVAETFGTINLASPADWWGTADGIHWSVLKFEFLKASDGTPYPMDTFITFYDFDEANNRRNRECVQFQGVASIVRSDNTEVLKDGEIHEEICEPFPFEVSNPTGCTFGEGLNTNITGSIPTFAGSVATPLDDGTVVPDWVWPDGDDVSDVYCSSTRGYGADNPGALRDPPTLLGS